ncbi:MAG TPA: phosphonate C-P lyase system protein PhnG [Acetobacteraceae bacterium]
MPLPSSHDHPDPARRRWMAVLARATGDEIASCLAASGGMPTYTRLRGPENGLVMVRGRAGGGGAAFNLGEMTVTRCSIRSQQGWVGHAYVAGRDDRQAELAALTDAMLQDPDRQAALLESVIAPLEVKQRMRRQSIAGKAAATRVEFFTMRTMRT